MSKQLHLLSCFQTSHVGTWLNLDLEPRPLSCNQQAGVTVMYIPELPKSSHPPSKPAARIHRFRVLATRYSTALIWVWCGVMILGMGKLHYDINIQKKKLGCKFIASSFYVIYIHIYTVSKDEIQPNPRVTATIKETFDKLGMDKVISQ